MDLSAVIFVVLALAWAVYLIPKALQHHDEMASDRLVEGHSDKVRILSRKAKAAVESLAGEDAPSGRRPVEPTPVDPVASSPARDAARPSRTIARGAAQRRRRVLGVLLAALVVVWALTWLAYLPIWAPAVPGGLVVLWLVIARLSVRRQQRRRPAARPAARSGAGAPVMATARADAAAAVTTTAPAALAGHAVDRLAAQSSVEARRQVEEVIAEEGSLWDPLPMTLPTYVNKARARRTVRTIELTGISSSGHDESDSALAREAQEAAASTEESESGQRRVAGA